MMIHSKEAVWAALDRAQQLGASGIDEACTAAAHALCLPVEAVRQVAFESHSTADAHGATAQPKALEVAP